MKPRYIFYDLFDTTTKRPLVTVCLQSSNGYITRGISICSDKDNFIRADGRRRARGRASWAFKHMIAVVSTCDGRPIPKRFRFRKNLYILRQEAMEVFTKVGIFFTMKADPAPSLTTFELGLINDQARRQEACAADRSVRMVDMGINRVAECT